MHISNEMVEAFGNRFWSVNAASKIDAERENIRAALEASINSSNQVDDGGPAYPGVLGPPSEFTTGMTIRDWFAGQADVPWNAVIETLAMRGNKKPTVDDVLQYRAEVKYLEADAMIAARKARS